MDSLEAVRNIRHFISAFKGKVDDASIYFYEIKKKPNDQEKPKTMLIMLIYLDANKFIYICSVMSKLLFVDI